MPSHQRSSANTSRRAHSNSPRQSSGSSHGLAATPTCDYAPTDLIYAAHDYEETLLDELKDKNTELNKAYAERDRLAHQLDLANKKLSECHTARAELKAVVQDLKDNKAQLKGKLEDLEEENIQLAYQSEVWDKHYTVLEKNYKELTDHYNAIIASVPSSSSYRSAVKLPERPKAPHKSSTRKEHKEPKEQRPRKSEKDSRDQRDRLSRRFEEKHSTSSRSRRDSFIEEWSPGAGGSATSAGSGARAFPPVAVAGHGQSPATSPSRNKVSFSSVPRTTHPLSPGVYKTSSSAIYDDYEDGNYHAYPVGR